MRGWKRKRYVERHRYFLRQKKLKRHLCRERHKCLVRFLRMVRRRTHVFKLTAAERKWAAIVGVDEIKQPIDGVRLKPDSLVIWLPEVFDFEKNYEDSATVISIFRKALICGKWISYIDFTGMKEISPACIMVFTCYADLWKRKCKLVRTRTETWQPGISAAFHQIGFFDILHLTDRNPWNPSDCAAFYMGLESHFVEPTMDNVGGVLDEISGRIEKFINKPLNRMSMYRSFTEAVTNVYHHAYTYKPCFDNLSRKWWLSVSYSEEKNELHIMIFDHGEGIPNTIVRTVDFTRVHRLYYKFAAEWGQKDKLLIAFEHHRTSSGKFRPIRWGRGHGCSDILRYLSEGSGEGCLSVLSDKARYVYSTEKRMNRGAAENLPIPLSGTLIEWRITP